MLAEPPEIAGLADRRARARFGIGIGRILGRRLAIEFGDLEVDLAHLEADDLDAEIELGKREVLELLGEEPLVPLGGLGEPVVGDHQSSALGLAETVDLDRRDLGPAEFATRQYPTMAGDH